MITSTFATLADLRELVQQIWKRDDKDAERDQAIQDTYDAVMACLPHRKIQDQVWKAMTTGREEYPLPDNMLSLQHPIRLIDTTAGDSVSSSFPMSFIGKDQYDELEPAPNQSPVTNTGRPTKYTIFKNCVLVTPKPDRNIYRLEANIRILVTPIAEATDQIVLIRTWNECIKAGALARLYAGIGMREDVTFWQQIYRFGFEGDEQNICGGLELLKRLLNDTQTAPCIVRPNNL